MSKSFFGLNIQDITVGSVTDDTVSSFILEEICHHILEENPDRNVKNLSYRNFAPRDRDRGYAQKEMDELSEHQFTRMFLLSFGKDYTSYSCLSV
jgi:hypothetical protein